MGLEFRREFRQNSYGGVWPAATPERGQAGRPRKRSCHEANSKSAAPSARFRQIRRLANFETLPTENVQHPGNSGRPQGDDEGSVLPEVGGSVGRRKGESACPTQAEALARRVGQTLSSVNSLTYDS